MGLTRKNKRVKSLRKNKSLFKFIFGVFNSKIRFLNCQKMYHASRVFLNGISKCVKTSLPTPSVIISISQVRDLNNSSIKREKLNNNFFSFKINNMWINGGKYLRFHNQTFELKNLVLGLGLCLKIRKSEKNNITYGHGNGNAPKNVRHCNWIG